MMYADYLDAPLVSTFSSIGERLLSRLVPRVDAGACLPDNGTVCSCFPNQCTLDPGQHYLVSIINCDGDCVGSQCLTHC